MSKRGAREGEIVHRADGRWEGRVTVGTQRKRKSVYGKTRADVTRRLRAVIQADSQGIVGASGTVASFLTRWLTDVAQPRVRPGTYRRYRWEVTHHLIPALGTIRLERLGVEDVQRMLTELSRRGAADNARATLRNALATAVKWRLLTWNAAELADLPKRTRRERRVLSVVEADRFLQAVRGDRLEALYVMALTMGLRQGELLGLRWSDIDFAAQTVTVGWQLQRGELTDLKSAAAHRTLPMPAMVTDALQAHLEGRQALSLLGLVFTSGVGTPVGARNLVRDFKKLLRRADLIPAEVRFHDLRHSAITFLIAKGIDPRTVQAIAGHSDIRLTLGTYSHPMAANLRDAAEAMDRIFDGNADGNAATTRGRG